MIYLPCLIEGACDYFCSMKKVFSIIILFFISIHFSFSQMPPGNFPSGGGSQGDTTRKFSMPKIGKVFGELHEAKSKAPVEFAAVAVMNLRDSSVVGGVLSDEKGRFMIEELPPGKMILKVTSIGYENFISDPFFIRPQSSEVNLGEISIASSALKLKDAEVVGEKSEMINSIDRKVYNMDKNLINTAGSATEALQNIPSVTVDVDGNVNLRGSGNFTLLVDGKPGMVTGSSIKDVLQQIPASSISEIEVITNPSSKYDAAGMAGIINIRTKKGKQVGTNATVTAGVGTNDKYNGSLVLNRRSKWVNVYGTYSYRHDSNTNTGEGEQHYFLPDTSYYYNSNSYSKRISEGHQGKVGADFYLNQYNTIGLSIGGNSRMENRPEELNYEFLSGDASPLFASFRNTLQDDKNYNVEGSMDFRNYNPVSKKEITASLSVNTGERNSDNSYSTNIFGFTNFPYQLNESSRKNRTLSAQTDFVLPVKKKYKFETGLKINNRNIALSTDASSYNFGNSSYENDVRYSDRFDYDETVAAAYAQYTSHFLIFDFAAGLRAEETVLQMESAQKDSTIGRNYLSLFPSASLKYSLKNKADVALSYSRRINRPGLDQLNPFVDYSDSFNIRTGNPFLNPEYVHSLDLSYASNGDVFTYSASVYYRHTDDLLSRFRSIDITTGVASLTSKNFNTSDNTGIEANIKYQIKKVGSFSAGFNFFHNKINADNVEADLQVSSTQWNTRLAFAARLTKTTNLQITGMFASKVKNPNSIVSGMMNGVDAGLKQDFSNGKLSLGFNVTDIFNQRKFSIYNFGDYYDYHGYRKRESRVATLTLTWRLGVAEQTSNRKKNQRNNSEDQGGGIDLY